MTQPISSWRQPIIYPPGYESLPSAMRSRGLTKSGAYSRRLLQAGMVQVNGVTVDGGACQRSIGPEDHIDVLTGSPPVGRGCFKLEAALDCFAPTLQLDRRKRLVALDLGSCTGGFTQVLLKRGFSRVFAVEKGMNMMAPAVRDDPRVTLREGVDVRKMTHLHVTEPVDLVVTDVYRTSILEFLCATEPFLKPTTLFLCLLKAEGEFRALRPVRKFIHATRNDLPPCFGLGSSALFLDTLLVYRFLRYMHDKAGDTRYAITHDYLTSGRWRNSYDRTLLGARILGFSVLERFRSPIYVTHGYREEFALLRWDWRPWLNR